MRRPPGSRPLVALSVATGLALALTGCDADGGTVAPTAITATPPAAPSQTAAPAPGPADTSGATMDDVGGTATGTPDGVPREELRAGAVLTNTDAGALVVLSPGESVTLRLTPPLQDVTPTVTDPDVVELVPVQHFADPGYDEYELLARAAGEARVGARPAGAGQGLVVLVVVQGG